MNLNEPVLPTRRTVLAGMAARTAQLLFSRCFAAAAVLRRSPGNAAQSPGNVAPAGLLEVTLTAVSKGTLRISISPADDGPRFHELSIADRTWPAPLVKPGIVAEQTVPWGRYTLKIGNHPLTVTALENGKVRQEIRFAPDSTDVHFDLTAPIFGLGEGGHPFDHRGVNDPMLNGQNGIDLRHDLSRHRPLSLRLELRTWLLHLQQGCLGDASASGSFTTRILAWYNAAVTHQLPSTVEAGYLAQLARNGHSRDVCDAAQCL